MILGPADYRAVQGHLYKGLISKKYRSFVTRAKLPREWAQLFIPGRPLLTKACCD